MSSLERYIERQFGEKQAEVERLGRWSAICIEHLGKAVAK